MSDQSLDRKTVLTVDRKEAGSLVYDSHILDLWPTLILLVVIYKRTTYKLTIMAISYCNNITLVIMNRTTS